MAMSRSTRNSPGAGFSLLEVTIAIVVLGVALLGAAALMAQVFGSTVQSRYMSTESLLASEKLDDLSRYLNSDPAIAVTVGTSAGDLNNDASANVATGGKNQTVRYWDDVQISSGNGTSAGAGGALEETVSSDDGTGNLIYTTITNKPDGTVVTSNPPGPPPPGPDTLVFKRRWLIEKDVPVAGSYRITVQVSLQDSVKPAVFQQSLVRQVQ